MLRERQAAHGGNKMSHCLESPTTSRCHQIFDLNRLFWQFNSLRFCVRQIIDLQTHWRSRTVPQARNTNESLSSKFCYLYCVSCWGQDAVSNSRPIANIHVMHNAAGQSSATRIGTFACRTFHRDTKASKRANLPTRDNELNVATKE